MASGAVNQLQYDVFTASLQMVVRHLWPNVSITVELFKDVMKFETIIRFKVPTPSGRVMFVTETLPEISAYSKRPWEDYKMREETIATITLLLG